MAAFARRERASTSWPRRSAWTPIDFRLKNAAKEGTKSSYGPVYRPHRPQRDAGSREERIRTTRRRSAPTRAAAWPAASGSTSAARPAVSLNVNIDGTVGARGRHARHRRLARLHVPDGGRGAGHSLREGPHDHRRHQLARLQRRHRRQPHHLLHRHGHHRGRPRRHQEAVRARRQDLGHPAGRRGLGEGLRQARRRQCRQFRAAVAGRHRRATRPTPAARSPATTRSMPMAPASASPLTSCDAEVDKETGTVQVKRYTRDPGCRQGHPSELCRRPVPGRRRPGHRLGAQRGVHLRQGRHGCRMRASSTTAFPSAPTCR